MGTLTNLNPGGFPPELVTESELAAAIAAHIPGDPHPQYLLEKLLPLLFGGALGGISSLNTNPAINGSTAIFDANNWQPDWSKTEKSAVVIAQVGSGSPSTNLNLPNGSRFGCMIQIDPLINSPNENQYLFQIFIYFGLDPEIWCRWKEAITWRFWSKVITSRQQNDFALIQQFNNGIRIGSNGTQFNRVLSQVFTIDPPLLGSGEIQLPGIPLTIAGAIPGDFVQIAPIGVDVINTGVWALEFRGVVTAANTVTIYCVNEWVTGSLNLAPFQVRVVVTGFN